MNSRLTLAGVCLLAAFGLAACGGGGGGTADTMPEPPPPTQAELDAAAIKALQDEIDALRAQLGLGADDDLSQSITDLMAERDGLQEQVDDNAEAEEAARLEAERMAAEAAAAEMMATAAKLYAGISVPTATDNNTADTATATGTRFAGYVTTAGTPTGASVGDIVVGISDNADVALSENKDAMVAAHHGWTGKMYTRTMPAAEGTYEAAVYSNVGEPTRGAKFNSGTGDGNVGFATTAGVLTFADDQNVATRIVSPSFDHSAGYKTFELPDPNPQGETMITIAGSYYGVAGMYSCTPAAADDGCRVNRASNGYMLVLTGTGGGAWTFTATDPEQRVTEMPDGSYASYGWWLHKSADDKTYTASAFVDELGAGSEAASGIDTLAGTARYTGGAAGKYALHSTTGGTNDAGHFTADVTLDADFNDDMISGTVDNFIGADGESRNWSVELMESGISATGGITGTTPGGTEGNQMTAWTIDGEAAADSGQWSGSLRENGDDGVPKVATGTFYTEYGRDGKMVGAFGANVD